MVADYIQILVLPQWSFATKSLSGVVKIAIATGNVSSIYSHGVGIRGRDERISGRMRGLVGD